MSKVWIVDERVAMVAVYRQPMINCISHFVRCPKVPYLHSAEGAELALAVAVAHNVAEALNLVEQENV